MQKIYIFALAATGEGLSGSDRIFIEFAKRWSKRFPVTIYLWREGYGMLKRQQVVSEKGKAQSEKLKIKISRMKPWSNLGFTINYFARIVEGIRLGLKTKLENSKNTIVYSASEFWMDCLPAFILKIRYPKIRWVAAWYQTAPNPVKGFGENKRGGRYRLSALIYWLMQTPIKPLISKFADFILVNNQDEVRHFPKQDSFNRAIVVLGAVDLEGIERFKKLHLKPYTLPPKLYDGIFQGRFHPQKGVVELIDIWKLVVDKIPTAKLVMIGNGPLMKSVKCKVQSAKLENNIILTGYLFDGEEKYKIFAQSKIVLHPAFYDSGGMAAAEAMAFGLPAVGFDLKAFKSYYPKGMLKVKIGNLVSFAGSILKLIQNSKMRDRLGREAYEMIEKSWSWEERARDVLDKITA